MVKADLFGSKKYLSWAGMVLVIFAVLLSPKAFAGADTNADGTCNTNGSSSSVAPSPYTNGAPLSKVFYPADGSTVTVTTTGAVIKQSPCQTPYREGWVDPAGLCNLNSFSQLSGMVKSGDSNPYSNNSASSSSSSCNSNTNYSTTQSAPSVVNNVQNTNTSSSTSTTSATAAPSSTTYTPNNNSYCNTNTSNCCNTSYMNNNNNSNCCNNGANYCCNNGSTNCCNNNNYPPTNCNTSSYPNNSTNCCNTSAAPANTYSNSKAATLPNTGPSDVLQLGGISTVLGTIGHYIYRRRATN